MRVNVDSRKSQGEGEGDGPKGGRITSPDCRVRLKVRIEVRVGWLVASGLGSGSVVGGLAPTRHWSQVPRVTGTQGHRYPGSQVGGLAPTRHWASEAGLRLQLEFRTPSPTIKPDREALLPLAPRLVFQRRVGVRTICLRASPMKMDPALV